MNKDNIEPVFNIFLLSFFSLSFSMYLLSISLNYSCPAFYYFTLTFSLFLPLVF